MPMRSSKPVSGGHSIEANKAVPHLQSTRFTSRFTILALIAAFCFADIFDISDSFRVRGIIFCCKFLNFSAFYITALFTPLSVSPHLALFTHDLASGPPLKPVRTSWASIYEYVLSHQTLEFCYPRDWRRLLGNHPGGQYRDTERLLRFAPSW